MFIYKRIGITVKPHLTEKEKSVEHIVNILRNFGAEIFIDPVSMGDVDCVRQFPTITDCPQIDVLLVIGGDGTILRAVRELHDLSIPILSINRGVLGFLAEIDMNDADSVLPKILSGESVIEERNILSITVERNHIEVFQSFSINEAVISQGAIARLLDLRTDINGEPLATFHADGLIIATPTGSTAYSLAAGGPVVHPRLRAIIVTPINPHSFTQKPIVIPGTSMVGVDVLQTDNANHEAPVSLTIDGQVYFALKRDDRVMVQTHHLPVRFIRRREDTFFHALRTKLRWGERL